MKVRLTRLLSFSTALVFAAVGASQWTQPTSGTGPIYYNSGTVTVGATAPSVTGTAFDVACATVYCGMFEAPNSTVNGGFGVLTIIDKSGAAPLAGVGGNISFRGVYNSTNGATAGFGGIKAGKSNSTDGNLDTYLAFFTRSNSPNSVLERMRIDESGRVGIGTTAPTTALDVLGDIHVSGNINAKYQDVAEWVPAAGKLDAGTVVVLRAGRTNEVAASGRAYDTAVAGVVSERPGITLGVESSDKELIATTGRVRVHVDATSEPIEVGDLLVTSDKPGTAMKSSPLTIGGVMMHRPGTIIGKALEALPSGTGTILVLLSMQ